MTLDQLIERLKEYRDALGGDAEVRLTTQQHWPFENEIVGIASLREIRSEDHEDFDSEGDTEKVVYLVEGRQLGYGATTTWDVAY